MKGNQREVYHAVIDEANYSLCCFCKYGKSIGCCSETECKHPLLDKSWAFESMAEDASCLEDCWGFRPSRPLSVIADVIGMILANEWQNFSLWEEDGKLKIAGNKDF